MIEKIYSTLFLVKNIGTTCKFYERLGFNIQKSDNSARIHFGDYRLAFMEGEKASEISDKDINGHGIFQYFEVNSIENLITKANENGLEISQKPVEQPWGKKELSLKDPDGFKLIFFEEL